MKCDDVRVSPCLGRVTESDGRVMKCDDGRVKRYGAGQNGCVRGRRGGAQGARSGGILAWSVREKWTGMRIVWWHFWL
jgi:hypothetical protein